MSEIDLQTQMAELTAANEKLQSDNNDLSAALQNEINTSDAFRKENETLKAKIGVLEEIAPAQPEIFTYEKKKYKISGSMRIPGLGERTAADIVVDKDAQKWLVENNSGLIKEVK